MIGSGAGTDDFVLGLLRAGGRRNRSHENAWAWKKSAAAAPELATMGWGNMLDHLADVVSHLKE
jgi:hypothetical protein